MENVFNSSFLIPNSSLIKVLIVDDHESLRNSFEMEFCEANGFTVVGSIAGAVFAEAVCKAKKPDIVIMDVCTEGEVSGLSAAEAILKNQPRVKIIVTSGFDEITYIPRAKEIGAHAFVYKRVPWLFPRCSPARPEWRARFPGG